MYKNDHKFSRLRVCGRHHHLGLLVWTYNCQVSIIAPLGEKMPVYNKDFAAYNFKLDALYYTLSHGSAEPPKGVLDNLSNGYVKSATAYHKRG